MAQTEYAGIIKYKVKSIGPLWRDRASGKSNHQATSIIRQYHYQKEIMPQSSANSDA
jgi:hypothetical protein